MGINHQNFSGNAEAFAAVRLEETRNSMELADRFTRSMSRTIADIMPKWPDTINAPGMGLPAGAPAMAPGMGPPAGAPATAAGMGPPAEAPPPAPGASPPTPDTAKGQA